jgi:hypothetical protein
MRSNRRNELSDWGQVIGSLRFSIRSCLNLAHTVAPAHWKGSFAGVIGLGADSGWADFRQSPYVAAPVLDLSAPNS